MMTLMRTSEKIAMAALMTPMMALKDFNGGFEDSSDNFEDKTTITVNERGSIYSAIL